MKHSNDYFERRNELYDLALLHIVTKSLHLATQLKLDKKLSDQAQSINGLAESLGFHPLSFFKFIRLLDAYDIVELVDNDKVKKGRLTDQLSDVRSPHIFHSYDFINELEYALKNNKESHSKAFGKPFYPYLVEHEDKAGIEQFREWCTNTAKDWLPATSTLFDLSQYHKVIDLGGGEGYFIAELLSRHPEQTGAVLDQPSVVENSKQVFDGLFVNFCQHSSTFVNVRQISSNFLKSSSKFVEVIQSSSKFKRVWIVVEMTITPLKMFMIF